MRKPDFCISENKDADQLRGNREADQRLCFPYTDSTKFPLLSKSDSSLYSSSVVVQPGLCRTWSQTLKTGLLTTRLIYELYLEKNCFLNMQTIRTEFFYFSFHRPSRPNFFEIEKKYKREFFQFYFFISLRLMPVQYWSSVMFFRFVFSIAARPSDSTW